LPRGTSFITKPAASASCAPIGSSVKVISFALATPIKRCRRCVPAAARKRADLDLEQSETRSVPKRCENQRLSPIRSRRPGQILRPPRSAVGAVPRLDHIDERLHAVMLRHRCRINRPRQIVSETDMPKYIVSQPAITLCIKSRSSRSPTTTSAPMARNALPCFDSSSVTVRPIAPTRPTAPVTRMGLPCLFLLWIHLNG
jgi:hypothetical protein